MGCLLDKTSDKKLEFEDFLEINKSQVNIFRLKGYIEQWVCMCMFVCERMLAVPNQNVTRDLGNTLDAHNRCLSITVSSLYFLYFVIRTDLSKKIIQ